MRLSLSRKTGLATPPPPRRIADVVEPPGADYCVITFTDPAMKPIEVSKPLGAGESQEQDEIRRALQYRLRG